MCETWFKKSKIKPDKECEVKCTAETTDMRTAGCEQQCSSLCGGSLPQKSKPSLITAYYYAYSESERKIIREQPATALQAYQLSWKAERLCSELYWDSLDGDESDACRHYSWAILMDKEIGRENAEKILNAHEEIEEPKESREMDIFNNKRAIEISKGLGKKDLAKENLENFKKDLKSGKLKFIRDLEDNRK